jgi:phosphoglycolate phosphatase
MNNLVMFDYDGVIVDSLEVFTSVFISACHKNGYHGIDSGKRLLRLFDGNLFEGMAGLGLDRHLIKRILKTFQADIGEHVDQIKLFDGMAEAMAAIARRNIIVIITSNVSHTVRQVLWEKGIDGFDAVMGAEKEKSKTRKIKQAMMRYPKRPAYYIGDTVGDIIEGRKASALTVAVTWGWHEKEKLKLASPDFMVSSAGELTELFINHEKGAIDGSR